MSLEQLKLSHSFILLQTNNQAVAKKLPYVVYTHQAEILDSETNHNDVTYNWTFDCSFYYINNQRVVLTSKTPIPDLLQPEQEKNLRQYGHFVLKNHSQYKLYMYFHQLNEDDSRFIQIKDELFIHPQGYLLFRYHDLPDIRFTVLPRLQSNLQEWKGQWYSFCSQYALLSDIHFLNSVRSIKAPIGSYLKIKDKWYPYLDEKIFNWATKRLDYPKL